MVYVQLRDDGVAIGYTAANVGGRPNIIEVESEAEAETVLGKRRVGETWEEVEVAPIPKPLDELGLIQLCQEAGGMTEAMLVEVYESVQLKAFVIKVRASRSILPSDERTLQGLGALEALGYLPNGAAAVLAAWPTA
jgi:hypothetical protein